MQKETPFNGFPNHTSAIGRLSMALIPKDMTAVYKATIAKGTNAMRWQRAAYVDLLPPCNNACPAGLNIQAWLSLAQAGPYEDAWRKYMEENPLPATHGRACYHPCESACNRQFLDQSVAVHSLDRLLGDLAIEKGWTIPPGASTGKRAEIRGRLDATHVERADMFLRAQYLRTLSDYALDHALPTAHAH
jgi:hypothetical protein